MRDILEILKFSLGFTALLLVGLAGVGVSEFLKLGEMNPLIKTIDNVAHVR